MSKQDMLKIQTCVLRVNIHCEGCKQKVKKILQKIEGVYTLKIDVEQGKVTISGNVDPATLIKKLEKAGKHAELWGGAQKGPNLWNNQFKNVQFDNFKGGKDNNNKSQKGGNQILQQFQQNKGAKDVKFSGKDQKTVKFKLPEDEEDDDFDDDFDEDDDDFDDDDFDDEFDGHHQPPGKMMNTMGSWHGGGGKALHGPNAMNIGHLKGDGAKNSGNDKKDAKKVGGIDMFIKGLTGKTKGKNDDGGKKGKGGKEKHGGDKNGRKKGGAAKGEVKNAAASGKGGNKNNDNWGKKGGEPFDGGLKMGNKHKGFDEIDAGQKGMGNRNMGPMGQMGNFPMSHMGNFPAVQGLPAGAMNTGHYPGMGMGMGMGMGQGNPSAMQQNMAQMMMMNQQRANGHDMYHPMMYARPQPAMSYGPYGQPPVSTDQYTHMFSDENTGGCSIM